MISLILFFMSSWIFAEAPRNWMAATEIVEKHEFYSNNQMIEKPKNSWQLLFGIVYPDARMRLQKDCVFYKVPGDEAGTLKIKTVPKNSACDKFMLLPGNREIKEIKALQYTILENSLTLNLTMSEYRTEVWTTQFVNKFQKKDASLLMSSAEYKNPKVIYLSPESLSHTIENSPRPSKNKRPVLCHSIGVNCEEISASTCSSCEDGWYEIPNGCLQGPKYCGQIDCGRKNMPACRRGVKYQKVRKEFDCTIDSSFAYCAQGLKVQCEGNQAYCR